MHTVILDAETIPFVDVTAAQMLDRVAGDLRRRGVRLVIARDVGLVRDVLDRVASDTALHDVYPSVRAAVERRARGRHRPSRVMPSHPRTTQHGASRAKEPR